MDKCIHFDIRKSDCTLGNIGLLVYIHSLNRTRKVLIITIMHSPVNVTCTNIKQYLTIKKSDRQEPQSSWSWILSQKESKKYFQL